MRGEFVVAPHNVTGSAQSVGHADSLPLVGTRRRNKNLRHYSFGYQDSTGMSWLPTKRSGDVAANDRFGSKADINCLVG